ncbi:response regulator [Spongiivirga sp. MCCC 1A20706]|uniref:response regulator n=1 Tax=Spongiivirga sp. MCCC 1A20706 TaxID=3160963 RepID=UPI003977A166
MSKPEKILLVDDDDIYLFIAGKTIRKVLPDIDIATCKNGKEAIQRLQKDKPNILFLDLNMPVMNGWSFLDELKKKEQELGFPIIIVTSSIDYDDKERAKSFDFVKGYIEKPLNESKMQEHLLSRN